LLTVLVITKPRAFEEINCVRKLDAFPSMRDAVSDAGVLVAWEAEADKPFLIKQPRRAFQNCNATAVVFNQVVVGGEPSGDLPLD
jgi:hypothetical protein